MAGNLKPCQGGTTLRRGSWESTFGFAAFAGLPFTLRAAQFTAEHTTPAACLRSFLRRNHEVEASRQGREGREEKGALGWTGPWGKNTFQ